MFVPPETSEPGAASLKWLFLPENQTKPGATSYIEVVVLYLQTKRKPGAAHQRSSGSLPANQMRTSSAFFTEAELST